MAVYHNLRDWLEQVDQLGELKNVRGADWNHEIGAVTYLVEKNRKTKWALLFDEIKGYPAGYRVLTGILTSTRRVALTVGLNTDCLSDREFILAWRERLKTMEPISAEIVQESPLWENIHRGDEVNLLDFPSPKWHVHDGGRYIGTASSTITRDPDDGSINIGTYRVMVHDEKTLGFYISPGKHGRIHRDKYLARGEACPVALVVGGDPLMFFASITPLTHSPKGFKDEYDWMGGVRGEPIKIIKGNVTGLPLPANAEIVLEGFAYPNNSKSEGPFGEWTGYYASGQRQEPYIKVEAVYHRNDPIICGAAMPNDGKLAPELLRSAQIWNELEASGVPELHGVMCYQNRFITVVSIRQQYSGHAKQAAMLAMQCHAGAYLGRYVIVVDEDIDVYDFDQVVWAMSTRVDPIKDIEFIKNCWSGPLDPIIPPTEKGFASRAIIDATKPYNWYNQFPATISVGPELKAQVEQKWSGQGLFDRCV